MCMDSAIGGLVKKHIHNVSLSFYFAIDIVFVLSFLMLCFSCASIQKDIYYSVPQSRLSEALLEIENDIILIDARAIEAQGKENKSYQLSEVIYKDLIHNIQDILENQFPDENTKARLFALKGRLELLFSKSTNASAQKKAAQLVLKEAEKNNPSDVQVLVLKKRLGEIDTFTNTSIQHDKTGILTIELALEAFLNEQYLEAITFFDGAFIIANSMYQKAYMPLRMMSWDLKDLSLNENKALSKLMTKDSVTIAEMIQIIDDNSLAFQSITGGKKYKASDLFLHIQNLGYFLPASKLPSSEPFVAVNAKDSATRRIGARLLWNLYLLKTSKQDQKNAYSNKYRARENLRSPIADIDLEDEDFDAILGCVEKEFLNLHDGSSFYPEKTANILEILEWIQSF